MGVEVRQQGNSSDAWTVTDRGSQLGAKERDSGLVRERKKEREAW